MKKKIALFANGWNSENLYHFMGGITSSLPKDYADFFVFLGHETFGQPEEVRRAESSVYDLADMSQYDGAIFFGAGMNFTSVNDKILNRCKEANIPLISISNDAPGAVYIHTDNYSGMRILAEHLVKEHDIKKVLFIAGPKDNKDSNDRLKALSDVLAENNISFTEEDIFYANWEIFAATGYVMERYSDKTNLPDAIICANDYTALFVSLALGDIGIHTPDDVLLTGYDGLNRAQTFYPSITSVLQPFKEMGRCAVECLLKVFNNESVDNEYYIPCEFIEGESCGCDNVGRSDELRRTECRLSPQDSVLVDFYSARIHYMEDSVLQSERYSTLSDNLQNFFYSSDSYEGNPFYILMDPAFAKTGEQPMDYFPEYTFTDTFDLIVGKNGSNHLPYSKHSISNGLLPDYDPEGESHIYVVMPLYCMSFTCGYMIMADNLKYFINMMYSLFKSGFNRAIDTYRKNLQLSALNSQLSELLNKDALTSTRNRVAYEEYKKQLKDAIASGDCSNLAFVMFDINNLKYINDNLGHESGDTYIKNSCKLICKTFKHSPVFRIGGDEFVAILQNEDFEKRDFLLEKFRYALEDAFTSAKEEVNKLSIASGIAVYDDSIDNNIDDTIHRADEKMYINKRMIKENEKR